MRLQHDIDEMLSDCFLAVGQGVGGDKGLDYDAIVWWRERYLEKFAFAVNVLGNSWDEDRDRVLAVSRWLGHRARHHAGDDAAIGSAAARRAAGDVEAGCRMNRLRNADRVSSAAEHRG